MASIGNTGTPTIGLHKLSTTQAHPAVLCGRYEPYLEEIPTPPAEYPPTPEELEIPEDELEGMPEDFWSATGRAAEDDEGSTASLFGTKFRYRC